MEKRIICNYSLNLNKDFEVIERKGCGHPDTLADELGERLSIAYSRYCLNQFGVILHHNFDKVGLMGGKSIAGFSVGEIMQPIRVLINGRASSSFGNVKIPLRELAEDVVYSFFKEIFPHIEDIKKIYSIMWEVACGSSPGAVASEDSFRQHWFMPRGKHDLSELIHLNCNDTSMGVAYYGNTLTEKFVLEVEGRLNSVQFKLDKPWLGSDIKIMCCRIGQEVSLTLCVPQIGLFVKNIDEYKYNLDCVVEVIKNIFMRSELNSGHRLSVNINMRDRFDFSEKDLYLTYTGSSIEMGDEGFVGRGNRFGGLITPNRFYSMEGIAGKNPVYHTGKMYSVFAYELSKQIWEKFNVKSETILVGMTGHALMRPHRIVVTVEDSNVKVDAVEELFNYIDPQDITNKILNREYRMF